MRVLYITQYYPPEIGAGAFRAESIVKGLIRKGYMVEVLCEFPCYPMGKAFIGYRKCVNLHEKYEGVPVHRVWIKSTKKMNFVTRMMYYLSFTIMAVIKGLQIGGKYDIIYATSPPLFVGLVGYIVSAFFRIPLVFEVRDLWPEIAIEMGEIRNKLAIKLALWIETFLYQKSSKIITVTSGFKRKICSKGVRSAKIHVVYNFAKPFVPVSNDRIPTSALELVNHNFTVIYAGLLGLFQGVDVIIRAAKYLKDKADIKILIIGTGTEEKKLKKLAREHQLTNIAWLKPQPNSVVGTLISRAGCTVVPLRNLPGLQVTIPSKLFDYMGFGSPVVLSASGEVADILTKINAGIVVASENPKDLSEAILKLYKNRIIRKIYIRNAMDSVKKRFSSVIAVNQIHDILFFS